QIQSSTLLPQTKSHSFSVSAIQSPYLILFYISATLFFSSQLRRWRRQPPAVADLSIVLGKAAAQGHRPRRPSLSVSFSAQQKQRPRRRPCSVALPGRPAMTSCSICSPADDDDLRRSFPYPPPAKSYEQG
ncbi:hypothetical protein LINGRAHAP2_LOCUS1907, partial [Linum grandiflorum]